MAQPPLYRRPGSPPIHPIDVNTNSVLARDKATQRTTVQQAPAPSPPSQSLTYTAKAPIILTGAQFSIPLASATGDGYLSAANFSYFYAKEPALGNPANNGDVLSSTTAGVRSWIAVGTGGSGFPTVTLYKPLAASFPTWVNQSSAAISDGTTGLVYYTTTAATGAASGYGSQVYQTFGAGGETTWECRMDATLDPSSNVVVGIALYESGSTKSVFFGYVYISGTGNNVYKAKYVGSVRDNPSLVIPIQYNWVIPQWFRARISGGTIYYEYSTSGEANDWILLTSNLLTFDFTTTPDSCGFCMINTNAASFVIQSALQY